MASAAIRALWAKAVPEQDPEVMAAMGMSFHIGEAYVAARISQLEAQRLEGFVASRDKRYLADQTRGIDSVNDGGLTSQGA